MPTQAVTFLVHVCNAPPVGGLLVLPAWVLALWAGQVVAMLAAVGGVSRTEELAVTPAVTKPTLVGILVLGVLSLVPARTCFKSCLGCFLLCII